MFDFLKKPKVHPDVKNNKCNCAVKFYIEACRNGMMDLTTDGIYHSINTRIDPEVNKYFCICPGSNKMEEYRAEKAKKV